MSWQVGAEGAPGTQQTLSASEAGTGDTAEDTLASPKGLSQPNAQETMLSRKGVFSF